MKTHFNYREINKLISITRAELHKIKKESIMRIDVENLIDFDKGTLNFDFKNHNADGFTLEEILMKLICAKKKAELKHKEKLEYQKNS
jgi:hypothetical protein